jgi:hypothetical protein
MKDLLLEQDVDFLVETFYINFKKTMFYLLFLFIQIGSYIYQK